MDDDYGPGYDDGVFSNRVSENECRTCGRTGCEGGPSCEMAAESRSYFDDRCDHCGCVGGNGTLIDEERMKEVPCTYCSDIEVVQ